MRARPVLILALLATFPPSSLLLGQSSPRWYPVDTISAGAWEDRNPALAENGWGANYGLHENWVLFERWTLLESRIEGRRFLASTREWDTTGFILSASPRSQRQQFPSYGEFGRWQYAPVRVAAWQQYYEGHWRVLIATATDSAATWSTPQVLAADTEDQTLPLVRGWYGTPLVSWRRGNVILGSLMTESGWGASDTLAVGADPSLEYDILTDGGGSGDGIIWRSTSADAQHQIYSRIFRSNPFLPTPVDTVGLPFDCSSPRLIVNPYPIPALFANVGVEGRRDLLYFRGESYGWDLIASDPEADEFNGRAFSLPLITKANSGEGATWSYFDACGYERVVPGDSALVFLSYAKTDTVRSRGFNRNLRIGSSTFIGIPLGVLSVWESNRTGTTHIYGRILEVIWNGVEGEVPLPDHPALLPNYPNPFNPSTTVVFEIPQAGEVTLDVVDLLGQTVAVLYRGEASAGRHQSVFDGSLLGSGVYYCRLAAGGGRVVRPMLLVR